MLAYWTVLKTLVACARTVTARPLVPRLMSFESDMSTDDVPGPRMLLRPASPNSPAGGTLKAAALKNSAMVGSASAIGAQLYSARSVPFVPRATPLALHSARAVKGEPDATDTVAVHIQSPKIAAAGPPSFSHRL